MPLLPDVTALPQQQNLLRTRRAHSSIADKLRGNRHQGCRGMVRTGCGSIASHYPWPAAGRAASGAGGSNSCKSSSAVAAVAAEAAGGRAAAAAAAAAAAVVVAEVAAVV